MEEVLEVRCAGCGDTLEVDRGLTEFACPSCATPQALPPELMPPPPPRPRRALPLGPPRGSVPSATAPARVPCEGCGAVLAVPRGLRRVACPLCGAEVDVGGSSGRLAAHSGVQVVLPPGIISVAATSSRLQEEEPISQAIPVGQVHVGRYNKPTHLENTGGPFPAYSARGEPSSSLRSNTRTAARVDQARSSHASQSIHIGESRINLLNESVDVNDIRKKCRPSVGHGSICINKERVEHPIKVIPRAREVPSYHLVHTEEAHGENQSCTIGRVGIQKVRHAAVSSIAEQEIEEPSGQIARAEQIEVDSCGHRIGWNRKRRRSSRTATGNHKAQSGGLSSSNEEVHLTGNHAQPGHARNMNPIQQPTPLDEDHFDPADIDGIIARLCPSSLPRKQVSQAKSNALDNIDANLPPISVNHGTPQGDYFSKGYKQYRAVATGSSANQGLNSAQVHEVPEESSNDVGPCYNGSQQPRQNPSPGVMHREHIQDPSDDSDSQRAQVESYRNKIVRHHKNTVNDSTYFSNEGTNIRDQPHGIRQQTTLVTACSNPPTALSPLLTATPLPLMSPSAVTRPPVQRPPPEHQAPDTLHSLGAQDFGIGSINESSKKRRGRGPTKLIAPRREADRPVLTPNNADTWDVDPPCPKVASTISALLKQWHPGSTFVPANQQTTEVHQEQLVLHWHQYSPDTRATIMAEFLQRYKWAPGQEALCLKLFDQKIVRQFTGLLCDEKRRARVKLAASRKAKETLEASKTRSKQANLDNKDDKLKQIRRDPAAVGHDDDDPLQWKPFPPEWMQPKWWEMLCEHWASEEVLQVSAQKRKNRYTGGSAQHTAGSRSIVMHRKLMIIENGGKPVSDIEVFNKTHKRDGGKGEFVSERAKKTVESFKRRLEEAGNAELDPHLLWAQEVGGRNRGRYYGLHGIIDKARIKAMSKCAPGRIDKKTQKEMFTQDQVQEMIRQAMQQLNETWEKRFESLEQKMHGMVSLEAPQDAPSPCPAKPAADEGSASHQDASDSSYEGTYQSATDDDEDYVDS